MAEPIPAPGGSVVEGSPPPPFPFILGVQRSGTTLLRAMFAAHPDVAIPDEATFLLGMCRRTNSYETSSGFDLDAFVDDLIHGPAWWHSLPEAEVRGAIRRARPETFSDAIRALYRHVAANEGKTRYGDKTPNALGIMPVLAHLLPEARFIHIIRDGRDVALSHVARQTPDEWFIESVGEVALTWSAAVDGGRRTGGRLGRRYREVRYESLIDDPEAVLRPLCEFIELPFDRGMLRYHERPKEVLGVTQRDLDFHEGLYLAPTKGLRDWRRQMPRRDLELFEAIAGRTLEELGYERGVASVPLAARARAQFLRANVAAKRAVSGRLQRYSWWSRVRVARHWLLGPRSRPGAPDRRS
ncbi:MAG TPA: sulfotransferase [Actinomycetota bacterium]